MTSYQKLFGQFLFEKCLYLGKESFLINKKGEVQEVGADYKGNVRLVILEKSCYFETTKKFPFSNIKDIRSAVEMDISAYSPLRGEQFFIKKIGDKGGTTVNIWFLKSEITEKLRAIPHLFVIPESALFSFQDRENNKIYNVRKKETENLFIFVRQTGLVQSKTSNRKEGDFQQFIRSMGSGAHDCSVTDIGGMNEFFSHLLEMREHLSVKNVFPFFDMGSLTFESYKKYIKAGMVTTILLTLFFFGTSVVVPYQTLKQLKKEDKLLSHDLSSVLVKQTLIDEYYSEYIVLAEKINSYPYKTLLLNQLLNHLPEDARISKLTVSGNVVEIKGRTKKVSALIGALSQAKRIKGARLSAPLKKDKKSGMELFRITFTYE